MSSVNNIIGLKERNALDLNQVDSGAQLRCWAEFIRRAHEPQPVFNQAGKWVSDLTGPHYYIFRSTQKVNQFILEKRNFKHTHYRRMRGAELIAKAVLLNQTAAEKNGVQEVFNTIMTNMRQHYFSGICGTIRSFLAKWITFFKFEQHRLVQQIKALSATFKSNDEDPRIKLCQMTRQYLDDRGRYQGFSWKADEHFEQSAQQLIQYWNSLDVFDSTWFPAAEHIEPNVDPKKVTDQNLLQAFVQLPIEMRPLYVAYIKMRFSNFSINHKLPKDQRPWGSAPDAIREVLDHIFNDKPYKNEKKVKNVFVTHFEQIVEPMIIGRAAAKKKNKKQKTAATNIVSPTPKVNNDFDMKLRAISNKITDQDLKELDALEGFLENLLQALNITIDTPWKLEVRNRYKRCAWVFLMLDKFMIPENQTRIDEISQQTPIPSAFQRLKSY